MAGDSPGLQNMTPKVLIADQIAQRGIEELSRDDALDVVVKTGLRENEIVDLIGDFSALIVRSETKVTAKILKAATRLRVIGRAGVGVDNVDRKSTRLNSSHVSESRMPS